MLADADHPGQSVLEDGQRVSAGTSQRLACDATRVVMRHDERLSDGGLRFRRPNGWLLSEAPPPVPVPHDPLGELRARHEAQGLCLHPWTVCGKWYGDRLDLSYAIAVLRPLDPGDLSRTRAGG